MMTTFFLRKIISKSVKLHGLALGMLGMSIVSCQASSPSLSAAVTPAFTSTMPIKATTSTGTSPPTRIAEPSITPTFNPKPNTKTPTPTPTLRQTATPTELSLLVWTPIPSEKLAATPDPSQTEVDLFSTQSPDGVWVLTITNAIPALDKDGVQTGDQAYDQVKLARADGSAEWILIDEWSYYGLGSGGYQPLLWSSSGETLYLTYQPIPDGCQGFVNGSNLLKMDLNSGEMTEILPSSGLWLSLSPDEKTVAFPGYGDRGLVLHDLATGEEREVKLDPGREYSAGHIVWSPDGQDLVLTLALDFCMPEWKSSILWVDGDTLETTVLIEEDERQFFTAAWPEPGKVMLEDRHDNVWWLDLETGTITP